jgi:peptide methionine sulfoxide reductase MsrB
MYLEAIVMVCEICGKEIKNSDTHFVSECGSIVFCEECGDDRLREFRDLGGVYVEEDVFGSAALDDAVSDMMIFRIVNPGM